jgi:uncharacterized protein YabN with tetrapyrrole methylase and pyrophosphatase domain
MGKLIVGGLGIQDLKQMTLETLTALRSADRVLYLATEPEDHLPELRAMGIQNVSSIFELYRDGGFDETNYERIYTFCVSEASAHKKTVLLVPGHPRIGVTVVQWITRRQKDHGLEVQIFAGISSFDTMLNDLARDPLEKGSLMIDANRMLLFNTRWDPTLDCYLYHVCSVGTRRVHLTNAKKDNAWDQLKTHLLSIYSADTRVELVSSSTSEHFEGSNLATPLSEIEVLFDHVHFGTTLFIAGSRAKKINLEFLKQLQLGS